MNPTLSTATVAVLFVSGCGPMYGFEILSPDVPLQEGDDVVYRLLEPSGNGGGGTLGDDLECDPDGTVCVTTTGHGRDEIPAGTEVTVWLDVDGDDWETHTAVDLSEREPSDLVPDGDDPRDTTEFPKGVGFRRIHVELRVPDGD